MRNIIHRAIVWYLRNCGGAFHCFPYGSGGRYIVLMGEESYAVYNGTISHEVDRRRLDCLETSSGVFYNDRYGGWRMTRDGGPNDKPWYPSARQAIDAALKAVKP